MTEDFKKTEFLAHDLKEYVNTRIAQAKLLIAEKLSKAIAYAMALLMAALVFFLFVVLLSVAGALAIGLWIGKIWLGFVIMAVLCLAAGIIMWLVKDSLLQKPIMNNLVEILFEKEEGDEKD
jgi:divalent metal cation (Fe/Co/Zn/Cd) transporter